MKKTGSCKKKTGSCKKKAGSCKKKTGVVFERLLIKKAGELTLLRAQLHDDGVVVRSRSDERLMQLIDRADAEESSRNGVSEVKAERRYHIWFAFYC